MATTGIESIDSSSASALMGQTKTLDRDDFLNLLVAQLQNQDPLNPTDSTEFTSQLAQFSSLEQLGNINSNLETLQLYQSSINNSQAVSFIGKEIVAKGDTVLLENGTAAECQADLPTDASGALVSIYTDTGEFVKSFETGPLSAGRQTFAWDGTGQDGKPVPDGVYHFDMLATDADGSQIDATLLTHGAVTGVGFKDNTAFLSTASGQVALNDVVDVSVHEPAADDSQETESIVSSSQINGGR
jgi:flagellar basal-body rod modification protein FlgD